MTEEQQRWTLQPELRRMIYNSRRWKEPKLNHEKAQARCKKLDSRASLLTLRSKFDEEKFIDSGTYDSLFFFSKLTNYFLKKKLQFEAVAFSDINNFATEYKAGDYWLGGYFDKENKTWRWMDGSEIYFDIWGE